MAAMAAREGVQAGVGVSGWAAMKDNRRIEAGSRVEAAIEVVAKGAAAWAEQVAAADILVAATAAKAGRRIGPLLTRDVSYTLETAESGRR